MAMALVLRVGMMFSEWSTVLVQATQLESLKWPFQCRTEAKRIDSAFYFTKVAPSTYW